MKELRNPAALRSLLGDIGEKARRLGRTPRLMEVCGTHTMALFKSGLTPLLAEAGVEMVSGPGCPVCITPNAIHEAAIAIVTGNEGVTLATFGDMTRVPTRKGSLQTAVPARDSRLRIVYSPEEALDEARRDPARPVVFFGAGLRDDHPGDRLHGPAGRGRRAAELLGPSGPLARPAGPEGHPRGRRGGRRRVHLSRPRQRRHRRRAVRIRRPRLRRPRGHRRLRAGRHPPRPSVRSWNRPSKASPASRSNIRGRSAAKAIPWPGRSWRRSSSRSTPAGGASGRSRRAASASGKSSPDSTPRPGSA